MTAGSVADVDSGSDGESAYGVSRKESSRNSLRFYKISRCDLSVEGARFGRGVFGF